ncbi:MAG TPA: hypothetical protein VMI10_26055 [Terriglobales bacterium]|nr:hypothetical protein [Terriglobales bacterium]
MNGRSSTVAPTFVMMRWISDLKTILNVENDFGGRAGLQAGGQRRVEEGFSPGVRRDPGHHRFGAREVERAAKADHWA